MSSSLKISPHLKLVATLRCEILGTFGLTTTNGWFFLHAISYAAKRGRWFDSRSGSGCMRNGCGQVVRTFVLERYNLIPVSAQ